jgi:hypothetical protein
MSPLHVLQALHGRFSRLPRAPREKFHHEEHEAHEGGHLHRALRALMRSLRKQCAAERGSVFEANRFGRMESLRPDFSGRSAHTVVLRRATSVAVRLEDRTALRHAPRPFRDLCGNPFAALQRSRLKPGPRQNAERASLGVCRSGIIWTARGQMILLPPSSDAAPVCFVSAKLSIPPGSNPQRDLKWVRGLRRGAYSGSAFGVQPFWQFRFSGKVEQLSNWFCSPDLPLGAETDAPPCAPSPSNGRLVPLRFQTTRWSFTNFCQPGLQCNRAHFESHSPTPTPHFPAGHFPGYPERFRP